MGEQGMSSGHWLGKGSAGMKVWDASPSHLPSLSPLILHLPCSGSDSSSSSDEGREVEVVFGQWFAAAEGDVTSFFLLRVGVFLVS